VPPSCVSSFVAPRISGHGVSAVHYKSVSEEALDQSWQKDCEFESAILKHGEEQCRGPVIARGFNFGRRRSARTQAMLGLAARGAFVSASDDSNTINIMATLYTLHM
jgi:hypothetical protein